MSVIVTEFLFAVLALSTSAVAQAQFLQQPESAVYPQGKEAVFNCLYLDISASYSWSFNNEFLSDLNVPSGVATFPPSGDFPARLTISAIPEYNNSVVQCEALIEVGGNLLPILSNSAVLYVQGPPTEPISLQSKPSTVDVEISWTPPFSLNLTTAEPDIQYCVDVYNVTGGGADLLESVCDFTDTSYTFSTSDPDQLFNFTVTPRSNVEGCQNGTTSEPVQGYIVGEPIRMIPAKKVEVNISANPDIPISILLPSDVFGPSPGRQPTNYTAQFNDRLSPRNCSANETGISGDMMILEVGCHVESHKIFDLTLFAGNLAGMSMSEPSLEISTHDVQLESAVYFKAMEVFQISCSFLPGSIDQGYLVIAVFGGDNIVYRVVYRNQDESTTDVSISGVHMVDPNNMVFGVYDLQSDSGLPEKRSAVRNPNITVDESTVVTNVPPTDPVPSLLSALEIFSENGRICINCSFSTSQLFGCVGIIHSANIMENENFTLINVTQRRGATQRCTDQTFTLSKNYTVTVFGQLDNNRLEETPAIVKHISIVETTPGSVNLGIPVTVVVVVVVVVIAMTVLMMGVLVLAWQKRMRSRVLSLRWP